MTRASNLFTIFVLSFTTWLLALRAPIPKPFSQIVPIIPLWVLVAFGSYSLATIGYSLATFGDCPEAHHSLMAEIQTAKADMRSKGLVVD
ncbi:dolichol-phosphate mannosyltransferase subunit 3 [Phlyctochytrium arcticum]|nr:dolichol-phosphate mannosyltransferase subunit 3 [Phlyctochytrium arcticum]